MENSITQRLSTTISIFREFQPLHCGSNRHSLVALTKPVGCGTNRTLFNEECPTTREAPDSWRDICDLAQPVFQMLRSVFYSAVLMLSTPLWGADWYWTGSTGSSWVDLTNWSSALTGGLAPSVVPGITDTVFFNADAPANPITTLGAAQSALGMVFNSNAIGGTTLGTLNDFTLTLGTGGINVQSGTQTLNSSITIGGNQTWTNNGSGALTAAGNIAQNGNLTLSGTMPISITGTITAVASRSLILSSGAQASIGALSTTATQTFTTAAGTDLQVNGIISGANVHKDGAGTVTFNEANSFTGNLRILDGTVKVNASNAVGGQLIFGEASGGAGSNGFGTLTLDNNTAVTFRVGAVNYVHPTSDGAVINSGGGGSATSTIGLYGDRTFIVNETAAATDLLIEVGISNGDGNRSLVKQSIGTMVMRGVNTYTGATSVDRGKLVLDYSMNNSDSRVSNTSAVNLRGGTLEMLGNGIAPTSETALSLNAVRASSTLTMVSNGGQPVTLNLTNGLVRAVSTGVINLVTNDMVNTHIIVGGGAANNSTGILGGWATYNGDRWATRNGSNQIVPLAGAVQNDKQLWTTADHVIIDGATSGILQTGEISSLILDSASGGTVTLDNAASALTLNSAALLVSADAGNNATSLLGGQIMTKQLVGAQTAELIVTNLSGGTFTLGANLGSNNTPQTSTQHLTLAGPGLINLTGNNHNVNGNIAIQGQVRLSGGNALSDYSTVTLATGSSSSVGALLDINGGTESIGNLGGGAGGDDTYSEVGRGEVRLGTGGTLILNQTASSTLSARITGTNSTLIKRGSGTFTTNNVEHTMTGELRVLGGLVDLTGGTNGFVSINTVRLRGGQLRVEQNATGTTVLNRLGNSAALFLEGTLGDGYRITSNQNASRTESVASLSIAGSSITITLDNTAAATDSALTALSFTNATSFSRSNGATLLVRGPNLGGTPTALTDATRVTFTNATTINAQLIGTSTTAGDTNLKVLPFAIGENSATGVGNTFLTVDSTVGNNLRTLTDGEYESDYSAAASDANLSLNTTAAALATKMINALRINSSAGAVDLTGDVGSTLTITSGGLLVSAGVTDNDVIISGYDAIRAGTAAAGSDELIVHVTSAHATPSGATLTIQSPITDNGGATSLTKAGNGTLVLNGINTYTGATTVNQGVLEFDSATGNLGSGTVRVSGGTLRWGTGNIADISAGRTVELLGSSVYVTSGTSGNIFGVGSTFDVGANNVTLSNSIGNNGYGGLTKLGTGSLTLSAAPTYTGATVISQGSMTFASIAPNTTEALHLIQTSGITSGTVSATIQNGLNVKSMIVGGTYNSGPGMTASVTVQGGAVNIGDGGGDDFMLIGYRDTTSTQTTVNHSGTVNFSAADSVNINVNRIQMGIYLGAVPSPNSRTSTGSLALSNGTNIITAGSILMGSSPASVVNTGTPSTLNLGTGNSTINVDSFTIGGIRSKADVTIGANGSFTLRGQQGGDTGANLFIGDNDATATGTPNNSSLNLTGASAVDMKVNLLVLGRLGASTNSGYGQGTLSFGVGTLDADTIRMGDANYTSAGTNPQNTKGTLNQTNTATVRFRDLSKGSGDALYNWQGGTIGNLANASLTNQNVTITLNGGGTVTDPSIRTFHVDSGRTATFQTDAALAGTGSFTKTGAGLLIFEGTNTHSGNLHLSTGTVSLRTSGSMNDVAWVNLGTGTVLDISQRTGAAYTSDAVISGVGTVGGIGSTFTVGSNVGSVNSSGILKPGESSVLNSLASAVTVGDQTGTLGVQGDLNLSTSGTRAQLQVSSTDRNAASQLSFYPAVDDWVDDIPNQFSAYMTGAGTGHDLVSVSGGLTLNGTGVVSVILAGGYQGVFGDVFNLFDWSNLLVSYTDNGFTEGGRYQTGSESGLDLDLPSLANGLVWDTSLFQNHGVVVVVPEPHRALLLLIGAVSLLARRRR